MNTAHTSSRVTMANPYLFRILVIFEIIQIIEFNSINGHALPSSSDVVELTHLCGPGYSAIVEKCLEKKRYDVKITSQVIIPNNGQQVAENTSEVVHLDSSSARGCHFGIGILEASKFRNVPNLKRFIIGACNLKNVPKGKAEHSWTIVKIAKSRRKPRLGNTESRNVLFLQGVFEVVPKLEFLSIHGNEISSIENGAFANLAHLKHINASDNDLDYFSNGWFDGSTNIEIMDFQENNIHLILRRAFAGYVKLKIINFDNNDISLIEPGAFDGLENLDYLGLRNNKLRNIRSDIFPNKIRIEYLAIGANYLNFLPTGLMERLSVEKILIDFNPWICPCLQKIYHWLFTTNATKIEDSSCDNSNVPICASENTVFEECSEMVDEEINVRYFGALQQLNNTFGNGCARLDYAP